MGWLAPGWLGGLLSLAVPLILHLRRRLLTRRIQVGSIRHLTGSPSPTNRRLKLHDLALLALRLGILSCLVLALAGPFATSLRQNPQTWTLVAPEVLGDTTRETERILDSLRASGAELRELAPNFAPVARGARPRRSRVTDLWSLLREADAALPPGSRIVAVLPWGGIIPTGPRPALRSRVELREAGTAVPREWLDAAWSAGDTVSLIVSSVSGGVSAAMLSGRAGAAGAPQFEPLHIRLGQGPAGPVAALDGDTLPVRTIGPTSIAVSAGHDAAADTAYLLPAAEAIASVFHVPLVIRPASADSTDWASVRFDGDSVEFRQPDLAELDVDGIPSDSFGRPLLSRRMTGGSDAYVYHGALDPDKSEMADRGELPTLLARLWVPPLIGLAPAAGRDRRSVDSGQLTPRFSSEPSDAGREARPWSRPLLAIAAALFALERVIVFRRRR